MRLPVTLLGAALVAFSASAFAHGEATHEKKAAARAPSTEEKPFGREGDPKKVNRTIDVTMDDRMRFTPSQVTVREGQTIRFRVRNAGKAMHEMVLGTMQELKEHAELMRKHPQMEHDEPYMAHVAPGKTETLLWHFTVPGEFYYGCLVAGHFEAGMLGKLTVLPSQRKESK